MKTTVLKGSALSPDILTAWANLQRTNLDLASPYFSPEFTQIVAAVRDEVEVAVVENGGRIEALFPYQRGRCNIAGPVGEFISDYQGLICEPDFTVEPRQLLRDCGLAAWDFNQLPVTQTSFTEFHYEQNRSPIIDLSAGYEAYIKERREAGSEQIKKAGNLMRRLERELGPPRFIVHSTDKALLTQLLAWKTAQYRQNRWRDLFSIPWVRQVVEKIHSTQSDEFAGMFSALYAGDRLVAAHFGMRSATVWHYWFPAYDLAFSKYSPGVILLLKMAEAAPAMGIKTIDLGCGEHSYKERLMNGFISTAKGSVELTCPATVARRVLTPIRLLPFKARCLISKTSIGTLARRIRDTKRAAKLV